jgi:hypothetical protein
MDTSKANFVFWIVDISGKNDPYAKDLDFQEAGEKLLEATTEHDGTDWALKPVKK